MEIIENKTLIKKLVDIKSIGVENDNGYIIGLKKDGTTVSLSQEVMELVVLSLMDKNKALVECFDRQFKISVKQV